MEPQITNFTKIERLILDEPKEADRYAEKWNNFVSRHPAVSHFQFRQEFEAWATTHPREISDTSIWVGKEIRDAYFYLRQRDEEKQMEQTGHVDSHGASPTLETLGFLGAVFLRERPKILEQDPDFKRILDEKADAWLKKHPGKDTASKEWIEYRYGSTENAEAETLYSDAEKEFREKAKENPRYQKRLAAYDEERKKIYDDPQQDPSFIWHQEEIELHTELHHELLKKDDPSITLEHAQKQVEGSHWERFAEKHPEKATAYAAKHTGIQEALGRVNERKEKQAIHEQLTTYQQTTGKEIHYVEDKTHKPPDINVEEASKRLGVITPPPPLPILHGPITPSLGLVDAQGRPLSSKSTQTPLPPPVQRPQPFSQPTQPVSFSTPSASFSQNTQTSSTSQMRSTTTQTSHPSRQRRFSPSSALRAAKALRPSSATSKLGATIARQVAKRIATFLLSLINPVSGTVTALLILTFIFAIAIFPATTGEASPFETGSSTIASCQFTRSGVPQSIKSNILQSIFQEVSQISGIPASVLAAVAMHENQTFTSSALDDHDAFLNNGFTGIECQPHFATSSTGALGFMQVQPPTSILPRARPDAYSEPGVRKGAELMGKTLESLTMQDFCDVRTSVYLGVGVLLSKNGMTPPTTADQVEKAVCGYFGSPCTYEGGFNYGQEARKDFEACQQIQATRNTSTITPPTGSSALQSDIFSRFGVTMSGFDQQHLLWAWEKFSDVSHTNFINLIHGVTINVGTSGSEQVNNNTIILQQLSEEQFKVVLTHELGHIIRWRTDSHIAELRSAISTEGYLTRYSTNAPSCTGSDNFNEDYAEMIAYYLNPNSRAQTTIRCSGEENPYLNRNHQLHYTIAREILGNY